LTPSASLTVGRGATTVSIVQKGLSRVVVEGLP
jgi:hypothetical protein